MTNKIELVADLDISDIQRDVPRAVRQLKLLQQSVNGVVGKAPQIIKPTTSEARSFRKNPTSSPVKLGMDRTLDEIKNVFIRDRISSSNSRSIVASGEIIGDKVGDAARRSFVRAIRQQRIDQRNLLNRTVDAGGLPLNSQSLNVLGHDPYRISGNFGRLNDAVNSVTHAFRTSTRSIGEFSSYIRRNISGPGGFGFTPNSRRGSGSRGGGELTALGASAAVFGSAAALNAPGRLERNILQVIATSRQDVFGNIKLQDQVFNEILSSIRSATKLSTVSQTQYSEALLAIAKDGLSVSNTIANDSRLIRDASLMAIENLDEAFNTEEIQNKIKQFASKGSFTSSDFLTLATEQASKAARALGEPDKAGIIADAIGDFLTKNINSAEKLADVMGLLASGEIVNSLVTSVRSSRFTIEQTLSALRNLTGVQERTKLQIPDLLQLNAELDRIGPSGTRTGTTVRRVVEQLTSPSDTIKKFLNDVAGEIGDSSLKAANISKRVQSISSVKELFEFIQETAEKVGGGKLSDGTFKNPTRVLNFFQKIGGTEAVKGFLAILTKDLKSVEELENKIKQFDAGSAIEFQEAGFLARFQVMRNEFQKFFNILGLEGGLLVSIGKVFTKISLVVESINSALKENPELARLVAVILKTVAIIASLSLVLTTLGFIFRSISIPIMLFGTALSLLISYFDELSPLMKTLGIVAVTLLFPFSRLFTASNRMKAAFMGLFAILKSPISLMSIGSKFGMFNKVAGLIGVVTAAIGSLVDSRVLDTLASTALGFMMGGPLGAVVGLLVSLSTQLGIFGDIVKGVTNSIESFNARRNRNKNIEALNDTNVIIAQLERDIAMGDPRKAFGNLQNAMVMYNPNKTNTFAGNELRNKNADQLGVQIKDGQGFELSIPGMIDAVKGFLNNTENGREENEMSNEQMMQVLIAEVASLRQNAETLTNTLVGIGNTVDMQSTLSGGN